LGGKEILKAVIGERKLVVLGRKRKRTGSLDGIM
jgi:hypothetical protein